MKSLLPDEVTLQIGTLARQPRHWHRPSYPHRSGAKAWVGVYAKFTASVEANNTLPPLPAEETNRGGYDQRLRTCLPTVLLEERFTLEFRESSWRKDTNIGQLKRAGGPLCLDDFASCKSGRPHSNDGTYHRLHGPEADQKGRRGQEALARWADGVMKWPRRGAEVYPYSDNDVSGFAPHEARELQITVGDQNAVPIRRNGLGYA